MMPKVDRNGHNILCRCNFCIKDRCMKRLEAQERMDETLEVRNGPKVPTGASSMGTGGPEAKPNEVMDHSILGGSDAVY